MTRAQAKEIWMRAHPTIPYFILSHHQASYLLLSAERVNVDGKDGNLVKVDWKRQRLWVDFEGTVNEYLFMVRE